MHMFKCNNCGGFMIVTDIFTDHMDLYCPHCHNQVRYPQLITVQSDRTTCDDKNTVGKTIIWSNKTILEVNKNLFYEE